jgi:Domain of unknown function (DUF4331)
MPRATTAILASILVLFAASTGANASSHREAPAILSTPQVDGTDFYMFRSYEPGREGFVTLIANYMPLQDAYGGPNYFPLDPAAFYDIHIDNNGDAVEDLTFRFKVTNPSAGLTIPVGGVDVAVPLLNLAPVTTPGSGAMNQKRLFTVRLIHGDVSSSTSQTAFLTNARTGGAFFASPFDNAGPKTFPNYAAYASNFIQQIQFPGCGTGRVFVGQRRESFAVNLGETFDLVNIADPVGDPNAVGSTIADKNITSLALEVPIDCLTADSSVIGGWTTASLPRTRVLTENPTYEDPNVQGGDFVQVSRLGMPLVNEVVIGLPDKNLFNASHPRNDGQFATYVTNPTLPELLEILFGVQAPNNFPRADLVAAFLTGVPGLNANGSVAEMQRLNTDIAATARANQSNLGVFGGDNAGFPNGRRPGDDVVDIELRAAMGLICHIGLGVCNPADAPSGMLPFTDQTLQISTQFDNAFPYLTTPLPGSPSPDR